MKSLTVLAIILSINALGQESSPLAKYDFKTNELLLLFDEMTHDTTFSKKFAVMERVIHIIDDMDILDSLKSEFRCNLTKQIDGPHEYVITIFKKNQSKGIERWVYNDTSNFSFGTLESHLIPVICKELDTIKETKARKVKEKWKKREIFSVSIEYTEQSTGKLHYFIQSYHKQ